MHAAPLLCALLLLALPTLTTPPAGATVTPLDPDARTADAYRGHLQRDAHRYVQYLDRALGLSPRQEAAVFGLVIDHAHYAVRYYGPRGVYPFPRQAAERSRAGRAFWDRTDAQIARVLTGRQRRAYHQFLYGRAAYDPRWERYDDQRWDDDRWGDDRWDRRDDRRRGQGRGNGRW